jgi:O-antigen ligase
VSVPSDFTARLPRIGFGIVVSIAIFAALGTDVALNVMTPAKVAFLLGGVALLIPTLILEDPKAYWLFLLVLSIPFDISKWLSAGLVDSQALVREYGQPSSATISIEIYLTDVVLFAMLLPWLARLLLRKEEFYFPKIGYLFLFYLAWSLLTSMVNAISFYLSIFELLRQSLYFLLFVYLINNINTRLQLRSVVWAVLIGFTIGASTVIVFFEQGLGTNTEIFASLHDNPATKTGHGAVGQNTHLTLHIKTGRFFGQGGRGEGDILRSQGMFRHPAVPACLCGLTLPLILVFLIESRTRRNRILLFLTFSWGLLALFLTFSRAGLLGLVVGIVVLFAGGAWSGFISRRMFRISAAMFLAAVVLSIPLLIIYLGARPESFSMRFNLYEIALRAYLEHPILGVGFNNGTAAMKEGKQLMTDLGTTIPREESADSYYLGVLMEVGPIGFLLLYLFFGKLVMIALRAMPEAAADMKPLLVGMIAGLASLATQNIADAPLAGHSVSGLLWLFAALIVAIVRGGQSDKRGFAVRPSI